MIHKGSSAYVQRGCNWVTSSSHPWRPWAGFTSAACHRGYRCPSEHWAPFVLCTMMPRANMIPATTGIVIGLLVIHPFLCVRRAVYAVIGFLGCWGGSDMSVRHQAGPESFSFASVADEASACWCVAEKGFAVLLYHPCCMALWEPCSCCSHSPDTNEDEHHAPFLKRPFPFKSTSKNEIKSLKSLKKTACKNLYHPSECTRILFCVYFKYNNTNYIQFIHMFWKEVSYAHQGSIYLIINTVKTIFNLNTF